MADKDQSQYNFDEGRKAIVSDNLLKSYGVNQSEQNVDDLQKSNQDSLEKGGKRAVIGERREFSGRMYIKTQDGWKFFGKGTGSKAQGHHESSNSAKKIDEKETNISELAKQNLAAHALNKIAGQVVEIQLGKKTYNATVDYARLPEGSSRSKSGIGREAEVHVLLNEEDAQEAKKSQQLIISTSAIKDIDTISKKYGQQGKDEHHNWLFNGGPTPQRPKNITAPAKQSTAQSAGISQKEFDKLHPGTKKELENNAKKEEFRDKLDSFLDKFPNDAKTWALAADEIRDIARTAKEFYNEYDLDVLKDDEKAHKPLNFKALKTPSEWNTKGKQYIKDTMAKMSENTKILFLKEFESWFK